MVSARALAAKKQRPITSPGSSGHRVILHYGTAMLRVSNDGCLVGDYYAGRDRRTFGRISCRRQLGSPKPEPESVFTVNGAKRAIRSMLSNREDISVVGEASDFYEVIEKTSELHPDLIILDLNLSDRNHIAPKRRGC
jgi:hypothetical protein